VQVLLHWLKYGMDPQAALDMPRLCLEVDESCQVTGMQQPVARGREGVLVHLEDEIDETAAAVLRAWGHRVKHPMSGRDRLMLFGRGQMIVVRWADEAPSLQEESVSPAKRARGGDSKEQRSQPRWTLWAGSDGRGDGCAMGW